MSLRQSLNQNPKLAVAVAASGILVAILAALWALSPGNGVATASAAQPGQVFFSSDDGKTYFADDPSKIPPFEKDGKQVYRAYVFKAADGKPFVSYLARYTPEVRQQLQAIYARPPEQRNPMVIAQLELDGLEVKAPGQSEWMSRSDPRATELTMPRLPDGSYAEPLVP
ncbi:hypothetical protein [Fontivita pretiosa]|uniref:hypothetical protein n=1 Tax=Fontivita pretiosa TaxID=2989684 RepID=UPI003D17A502